MPEVHARLFQPSKAETWMTCAASVALTRDNERTSNEYADEGTAAHILASRAFEYKKPAKFWIGEQIQAGERVFTVDESMAENVQVYIDDVQRRLHYGDTFLFEERVAFNHSIGQEDGFGTADAIILRADCRHVTVEDLKFGQGVRVYATENKQLLTYAAGVLETFDVIMSDVESVTLVICQPRLDHIDEWEVPVARVHQHIAEMREAAAAAIAACAEADGEGLGPERYAVSEKGCMWCEAKATCDAYRQFVASQVYGDFDALETPAELLVDPAPAVPAGKRLGELYGVLDMIEDWARAVRGEVERMVLAGMTVIGTDGQPMKIMEGKKGNRAWRDPKVAEGVLVGLLPPEKAYKPREIVSPSVADTTLNGRAKVKSEQWVQFLQPLIVQAPGKPKVVLGSAEGVPFHPEASADEFASVGVPE